LPALNVARFDPLDAMPETFAVVRDVTMKEPFEEGLCSYILKVVRECEVRVL